MASARSCIGLAGSGCQVPQDLRGFDHMELPKRAYPARMRSSAAARLSVILASLLDACV
jgi:hypothetical protein